MLEEAEWQTEVATQGIFTAKIQTAASLTALAVVERAGAVQKRFFLNFSTSWPQKTLLDLFRLVVTIGAA